jgi:hypothetical protein
MKATSMTDPALSSAVGGFALWKALTAAAAGGSVLATIVVMVMTRPRTGEEWAVGLISTVVGSLGGGAYAAMKLGVFESIKTAAADADLFLALLQLGAFMFACGLPAWAVVRWSFNYMDSKKGATLPEVIEDAKRVIP